MGAQLSGMSLSVVVTDVFVTEVETSELPLVDIYFIHVFAAYLYITPSRNASIYFVCSIVDVMCSIVDVMCSIVDVMQLHSRAIDSVGVTKTYLYHQVTSCYTLQEIVSQSLTAFIYARLQGLQRYPWLVNASATR